MQRITRPTGPFDHPVLKGGAGSGNHEHAGRPGERGGSAAGSGSPLHEAPVGTFHAAFEKAFAGSEYSSFVTHYSPEDLAKMKAVVTTPDGKAGFAVKDHGDGRIEITALYNTSDEKGLAGRMLDMAVQKYGVNYLECFGPYLPTLYSKHGFVVENTYPFDKEQAPKDWNTAKFGTPDYFTMRHKGQP